MLTLVAFAITGGPVDDAEAKQKTSPTPITSCGDHIDIGGSTLRIVCVRIA